MSLTLNKIELFNFRLHKHFVFNPEQDGITAISGHNGSGKSTIVDAFAWALYGTRPPKVTNKMLIKDFVDPKDSEVSVTVEITINKIVYKIVRRIVSASGASDCNVYGKSGTEEYHILAGPAVTSAEAYIKQIMGMDEKGFLTSVLIQQKQVDQIVSASPRERAAVIEKLTGISSITSAIDMSRSETKAYQKAAGLITIKDSETIKKDIIAITTEAKDLKVKIKDEFNLAKKNKELLDLKSKELALDTERFNHSEELTNNKKLLTQEEKMLNEESSRIITDLSKFKRSNNKSLIVSDPNELKDKYDKSLRVYLKLKNKLELIQNDFSNKEKSVKSNSDFINKYSELVDEQSKAVNNLSKINETIDSLIDETQVLNSDKKRTRKALSTISSGDMVCPICKRPISNPEELSNELHSELDIIIKKEKEVKKSLKETNAKKEEVQKLNASYTSDIEKIKDLISIKDTLSNKAKEITDLNSKVIELKSKSEMFGKNYDRAVKQFLHKEDIDNKKKRLTEINEKLGEVNGKLDELNSELSKINSPKKSELTSNKNQLNDMQTKQNNLFVDFNKDKSHYTYLQDRYKDLRTQYDESVKAQKKYNELTGQMKLSAITGTVMSDFKVDRIQFAVPTIEMYASTILSQFTDSKFTQLKLDGKFNASVITSSGQERPIAQLSGGELSAAAIALRLSISMLLNGADKNVIIFDEVLVSMDEIRARKIMETISSVTNSQIIFIAHNSDIDSVADLVVQVGKNDSQEE